MSPLADSRLLRVSSIEYWFLSYYLIRMFSYWVGERPLRAEMSFVAKKSLSDLDWKSWTKFKASVAVADLPFKIAANGEAVLESTTRAPPCSRLLILRYFSNCSSVYYSM